MSNLYSLGPCLTSALSVSFLKNMTSTVFVSYFSLSTGSAFQPNETETIAVQEIIK